MHPLYASIVRTLVPIVAGTILGWGAMIGFNLDAPGQEALVLVVSSVLTGAYYVVVRLIEERVPWVGWLIGYAKAPTAYAKPAGRHAATN